MKFSIFNGGKIFFVCLFLFSLFLPISVMARAQTGTCGADGSGGKKSSADVGVFLAGVCDECWDSGDCGLNDFLTVVANVGNYILAIIAALVFFVYILGGFFWIIAHGDKGYVDKGKKYMKNATIGLAIVLFAYIAVVSLRSVVTGEVANEDYVICSGTETNGQPCAPNSKCDGFSCVETE